MASADRPESPLPVWQLAKSIAGRPQNTLHLGTRMFRSQKIGRWMGIDVTIHWTFWILMFFSMFSALATGGLLSALIAGGFIIALFACVVAHEYGHALAAAGFGIPTHDITVLPIGGLARLARLPDRPIQELWIALAGPAVNLVIFAIMMAGMILGGIGLGGMDTESFTVSFLSQLMAANLALAVFNLLPAFPMDGGRVLRSLLALRVGHLRATEIAVRVGRWMALVFLIAAFWQPGLALISVFVFFAGTAELFEVRRRSGVNPLNVQWTWTSNQGAWTYRTEDATPGFGRSEVPLHGDVIDAVDVREVKATPLFPQQ